MPPQAPTSVDLAKLTVEQLGVLKQKLALKKSINDDQRALQLLSFDDNTDQFSARGKQIADQLVKVQTEIDAR